MSNEELHTKQPVVTKTYSAIDYKGRVRSLSTLMCYYGVNVHSQLVRTYHDGVFVEAEIIYDTSVISRNGVLNKHCI